MVEWAEDVADHSIPTMAYVIAGPDGLKATEERRLHPSRRTVLRTRCRSRL
jgi:hypothetical protein